MKHVALVPGVDEQLSRYAALIRQWNPRINLIAAGASDELGERHIRDCLQIVPLIPAGNGPIADLGSGAGLPGIIVAIAEPGRTIHLVESDKRKAAFLSEAARVLGLANVAVHAERIERAVLPPISVVLARALAPLPQLIAIAAPLMAPDGIAMFHKGRNADAELTQVLSTWTMQVERFASQTDPAGTILRLSEIRKLGAGY